MGTQGMWPALPGRGGHSQAAGAPHFLPLPQAVSRQRKPLGTELGGWDGEKGGTRLLKSVSLVGDWIPSFRKLVPVPPLQCGLEV